MIRANATVDVIRPASPTGDRLGRFRVEVWGIAPHDFVRVYEISAADDNIAAREGLDRFVAEISELLKKQDN